jgi:hypothetical protein
MRTSAWAPLLSVVLLAGCQQPDVGQACSLTFAVTTPVSADFLEFGSAECEDTLICVQSPTAPATSRVKNNPYCSKPCVSDTDCSSSDTGLICRDVVLDEAFIRSLDPAVAERYLGDARFSKYCASPLPAP